MVPSSETATASDPPITDRNIKSCSSMIQVFQSSIAPWITPVVAVGHEQRLLTGISVEGQRGLVAIPTWIVQKVMLQVGPGTKNTIAEGDGCSA